MKFFALFLGLSLSCNISFSQSNIEIGIESNKKSKAGGSHDAVVKINQAAIDLETKKYHEELAMIDSNIERQSRKCNQDIHWRKGKIFTESLLLSGGISVFWPKGPTPSVGARAIGGALAGASFALIVSDFWELHKELDTLSDLVVKAKREKFNAQTAYFIKKEEIEQNDLCQDNMTVIDYAKIAEGAKAKKVISEGENVETVAIGSVEKVDTDSQKKPKIAAKAK